MEPPATPQPLLADRLKSRTSDLHRTAERSGVTAQILRGQASLLSYARFLSDLLPIYREMEEQLDRLADAPALRGMMVPALRRQDALAADLAALMGPHWEGAAHYPPETERYVDRIKEAASGDGARLIAHAYVRYLGDLNGGQALARLLNRSLGLGPEALSFYAFPGIRDLPEFRLRYRQAIDQAGLTIADLNSVVEEAALAFQMNIDLSQAALRNQEATVDRTAALSKPALA